MFLPAVLGSLLLAAESTIAYTLTLSDSDMSRCVGMWGPNSSTKKNGTISIIFHEGDISPPIDVAVLVYNVLDEDRFKNKMTDSAEMCTNPAPASFMCNSTSANKFIIQDSVPFRTTYLNSNISFTKPLENPHKETFIIPTTGLYCILVDTTTPSTFKATVTLMNPDNHALPGADLPKLNFFLVLSCLYLALGLAWTTISYLYWSELLLLQHYVTAVIFFLMIEMAFNYGYFEYYDAWGYPNKGLEFIVILLNAGRNSISFFMLLIVALGYGVVKPTLGSNMIKCVGLGFFHFFCGVLYTAGSLKIVEMTPLLALVFTMPLSTAMTMFYFFILNGITATMEILELRRQGVKLLMYKRLWSILVFSAVVLSIFFVVNTIYFSKRSDPAWIPTHWQYRWFLLDGWLNILFLIVFSSIAFLWRPTPNNRRYGLDELASEDWDEEAEAAVSGGVYGNTGIKLRNIRGMPEGAYHDDDGGDDDDEEEEEDLFQWAEQNLGAGGSGGGQMGSPSRASAGFGRGASEAMLLTPSTDGGSMDISAQKME